MPHFETRFGLSLTWRNSTWAQLKPQIKDKLTIINHEYCFFRKHFQYFQQITLIRFLKPCISYQHCAVSRGYYNSQQEAVNWKWIRVLIVLVTRSNFFFKSSHQTRSIMKPTTIQNRLPRKGNTLSSSCQIWK